MIEPMRGATKRDQLSPMSFAKSGVFMAFVHTRREESPNDPKLSHGRAWRGPCAGEGGRGRRWREAWAVTCTPVGCSAWLGVSGCIEEVFQSAKNHAAGDTLESPIKDCCNNHTDDHAVPERKLWKHRPV